MIKIDDYAYTSGLKDVHPVEKVSFVLTFLLLTTLTRNILVACLTFTVMSLGVLFKSNIPFHVYLKLLLVPFAFLITSVIAIFFSITPILPEHVETVWLASVGSWQIYISPYSIQQSYQLTATVMASVSCLYFLILSTPLQQIMWVLKIARLPSVFIELIGITYRFIYILLEKTHEIFIAQSSRLGYQNNKSSWLEGLSQLIVCLFIKSIQSAKELQISIDSRGGDELLYDVELRMGYSWKHFIIIAISFVLLLWISIIT
ncbi:cobalt ECF transporter T component CbiQ [Desulfuribacillus stibiiarsenatis]|uniref:Cobalt ECF transporter T component CbiQ n=1 Tax=Desulfuribacillus stibiiarsenatis TaxID=1390249 RepID=A0A1E5L4K9_9FIRM|nr:cobalt ECF transporter T component CbiQ [Desulfuribacillus stibiiarsenatis]OEH85082.1 cobalt ECF transporter T component CbiQ [Desulfuribacillus stibiiarsenatis]